MFTDDWGPDRMMNGSYGDGGMYGGAWMMLLVAVILVALLATAIVLVVRLTGTQRPGVQQPGTQPAPGPEVGSPRDILDQRLARGEITPEDYRATRSLLGS